MSGTVQTRHNLENKPSILERIACIPFVLPLGLFIGVMETTLRIVELTGRSGETFISDRSDEEWMNTHVPSPLRGEVSKTVIEIALPLILTVSCAFLMRSIGRKIVSCAKLA